MTRKRTSLDYKTLIKESVAVDVIPVKVPARKNEQTQALINHFQQIRDKAAHRIAFEKVEDALKFSQRIRNIKHLYFGSDTQITMRIRTVDDVPCVFYKVFSTNRKGGVQ